SCGLVVGKIGPVDLMRSHRLAKLVRVPPSTAAALAVTMTLHRTDDRPMASLPLASLRSTPLGNLKLRAERMAAQLHACPAISSAQTAELPAGASSSGLREQPSWGVQLSFKA